MTTIPETGRAKKLKSMLSNGYGWLLPCCGLCNSRLLRLFNFRPALLANHREMGNAEADIEHSQFICFSCLSARSYSKCCKTSSVFRSKDDCMRLFRNGAMFAEMSPYHASSQLEGPLSPQGLEEISREYAKMLELRANWVDGSKRDFLDGHRILTTLRVIREDRRLSNPMEVEEALKQQAVQIGGNGYIKFFWKKNEERSDVTYVAGHGYHGNPYYKTKTNKIEWYTGYAECVLAEAARGSKRNWNTGGDESKKDSGFRGAASKTEGDYLRILGVAAPITKEDFLRGYRVAMMQYHPDRVAHLGADLRTLAAAKAQEINEAKAYFEKRYGY